MWVDFYSRLAQQCLFVLLRGFRAKRFKVRGCLLCQEVAAHPFNRENSTFYLHSMATISHTISHSMYLNPRAVSILASHQSAIVDQTPRFNNSEFIDSSSQSFLNLVITMDPDIKWDLSNTLPQWPQWIEEDPVEMLFNRTEMGLELKDFWGFAEPLRVSPATFSLLDRMADSRLRFGSVSILIRQ